MKRSSAVPLFVLGTMVCLPGCGQDRSAELRQNRYLTREDCQHDWGDDQDCTPAPGNGGNGSGNGGRGLGGGAYYYYGPRYYWDPERERPVTVAPDGQTRVAEHAAIGRTSPALGESLHLGSITRGGFGGFGRGFSLGG